MEIIYYFIQDVSLSLFYHLPYALLWEEIREGAGGEGLQERSDQLTQDQGKLLSLGLGHIV